ncbi:Hint domain-containing protein, partial [Rhodovulum visakhapatnamense]|nr:Hint domain-containing protein [Rhodovulum visakhapatnamense]
VHDARPGGDPGLSGLCFPGETAIATPRVPVRAASLVPGMTAQTVDHGPQMLVWGGQRAMPGSGRSTPVEIPPGAFGNTRRLWPARQARGFIARPGRSPWSGCARCWCPRGCWRCWASAAPRCVRLRLRSAMSICCLHGMNWCAPGTWPAVVFSSAISSPAGLSGPRRAALSGARFRSFSPISTSTRARPCNRRRSARCCAVARRPLFEPGPGGAAPPPSPDAAAVRPVPASDRRTAEKRNGDAREEGRRRSAQRQCQGGGDKLPYSDGAGAPNEKCGDTWEEVGVAAR